MTRLVTARNAACPPACPTAAYSTRKQVPDSCTSLQHNTADACLSTSHVLPVVVHFFLVLLGFSWYMLDPPVGAGMKTPGRELMECCDLSGVPLTGPPYGFWPEPVLRARFLPREYCRSLVRR